jgi:hypothetical protein
MPAQFVEDGEMFEKRWQLIPFMRGSRGVFPNVPFEDKKQIGDIEDAEADITDAAAETGSAANVSVKVEDGMQEKQKGDDVSPKAAGSPTYLPASPGGDSPTYAPGSPGAESPTYAPGSPGADSSSPAAEDRPTMLNI